MTQDKIFLEGMIFFGFHGTLPEERTLGQRFVVDIELRCDLRAAGKSDDLSKTVDYSQVYEQARTIVEGEPVNLTETVAERIATAVLRTQPLVESIRVKVAKPHVRLGATVLAGSAVEIVRSR
ncbi:MAG TPA: dihydroneopterin aldolase [Roseiflexaceae bacterium]|jgi:dihydroneopterin aldolase|nr:dihydroneopterin aldolase [Roseiflexaceae bacterium]